MPQYTYPGVYVEEIPSGVHTISGVATSITAFIDFFKEGPINKAVEITSLADFNRIFGGLDTRSEASYAINQFFLNGGTHAHVIRVADADIAGKALAKAQVIIKSDVSGGSDIIRVKAISEGIWGNNLRVDIDHNTEDPANLFNFSVTRYDGSSNSAKPMNTETYLNLSMDENNKRYAIDVVNEKSDLIELVRESANVSNTIPAATGLRSGDIAGLTHAQITALNGKTFNIQMGTATQQIVTISWPSTETVDNLVKLRKYLEIAIRKSDATNASASYTGAKVELLTVGPAKYFRILSGKKSTTYKTDEVVICTNIAPDNIASTLKLTGASSKSNVQEYVVGSNTSIKAQKHIVGGVGGDGDVPEVDDLIGSNAAEPYTGMYALDYVDLFNILCIPRAAELSTTNKMQTVISNALTYCAEKRAFLIIDIPKKINEVQEMKDWIDDNASLRDKNAAVYFPRLLQPDPLNEYRNRSVGASGTMAGIYSRIDSTRGVWKAAAGTEVVLRGISGLDVELTDAQNGLLNPLAVNCIRVFPIYGMVSWGARTLDGSDAKGSEWKYIPIRRLALFLEESLFRGTKWVVFEPNDEPLWAKIRMNINAFMMRLFKQGAFQGTTPDKAFYVKCDSETTTQTDRNLGIVNIEVGFAPLRPAEFVVIKIQQIANQE